MGIAVTMEGREADKNEEEKERETRSLDEFFFPSQRKMHNPKGHDDKDNLLMS